MTTSTLDDTLLVRPSVRAQLKTVYILLSFVAVYVLAAIFGLLPLPIIVAAGLVFLAALMLAAVTAYRSRHADWELKLDGAGVSVRGRGSFPWSDVAEVTITPLWPGRLKRLSWGYRVVAFVGRPGVTLPSLPSTDLPRLLQPWAERRRLKMVGTLLIIPPAQMDTRHAEIEAAVRRLSDVPVRRG